MSPGPTRLRRPTLIDGQTWNSMHPGDRAWVAQQAELARQEMTDTELRPDPVDTTWVSTDPLGGAGVGWVALGGLFGLLYIAVVLVVMWMVNR